MSDFLKELLSINEAANSAPMKYEWAIQGKYEGGWEDVNTVNTRKEALESIAKYRANEKGTEFRFVRRKEDE